MLRDKVCRECLRRVKLASSLSDMDHGFRLWERVRSQVSWLVRDTLIESRTFANRQWWS
jgi:hypothetical protein